MILRRPLAELAAPGAPVALRRPLAELAAPGPGPEVPAPGAAEPLIRAPVALRRRRLAAWAAAWALAGCGSADVTYRPSPQLLPSHIRSIAVRPFANRTQQFGLEDKLTLRVVDEFLRNGEYRTLPESQADGVVVGTVTRYILTPIQYDPNLVPTAYKLQVFVTLQFIDRTKNQVLWEEPNLEGTLTYNASTLPGGLPEEQARERIWDILVRDIVRRTVQGFGAVTGTSQKKVGTQDGGKTPLPPSPPLNPQPH